MATIKQLGFKTSVDTGTRQKESAGQGLAKLIMTGAQAYEKKLDIDRVQEDRERAAKNRTDKENLDLDYLNSINKESARIKWEKEHDYVNLDSSAQVEKNQEFDTEHANDFITEKYKAVYNKTLESRDYNVNTLLQEEQDVAVIDNAKNLINMNLAATPERMDEHIDALKGISKKFTKKQYLELVSNNVKDVMSNDIGKYMGMKADDIIEEFGSMKTIKDKELRGWYDKFIREKRVLDLVDSGNYLDGSSIVETSKKTGLTSFEVYDKAKSINEKKIPMLLQSGRDGVTQAIKLQDEYGFDEKIFHDAVKSSVNKGQLGLYYTLRDKIIMPDEIAGRVNGYEFLSKKYEKSLSDEKDIEQLKIIERDLSKAGFKLSPKEKSKMYKDLSISEASFYRKNESMASKFSADADDVEDYLKDLYKKQSVDGVPFREVGVQTDSQKAIVENYIQRRASGQKKPTIDLTGGGYNIVTIDKDGKDKFEFRSIDQMKTLVKDAYEFNDADKAADAIVTGNKEFLNRRTVTDVKIVEDMINKTKIDIKEAYKEKLTDKEFEILDIMIKRKYSDMIKKVEDRRDSKGVVQTVKDIAKELGNSYSGSRNFSEIGEAFETWSTYLFGGKNEKSKDKVYKIEEKKKYEKNKLIEKRYLDKYKEYDTFEEFIVSEEGIFFDEPTQEWHVRESGMPVGR